VTPDFTECIGQEISCGGYSTRHSDIWSLGVILTNMISGRNPWRYAKTKDPSFSAYLHNPDSLRLVLPISRGVNEILKRIFALNPQDRITLPELRTEILKVDTFLMSGDELVNAPEYAKAAARAYGTRTSPATIPGVYKSDSPSQDDSDSGSSFTTTDSDESSLRHDPACSSEIVRSLVCSVDITEFSTGVESSSSDEESEGPITPETIATVPVIVVPDLPDGMDLGEPLSNQSKVGKKYSPHTNTIRNLVGRLLAI
jgi:serine/threonine protein kinase